MTSRIYYAKPSITEVEIRYATDAATNGWGEKCYEYIKRFEDEFKSYLGVRYAIATSSCTGALHMGLAALGIGAGDEVIVADTNWIATVSPIAHVGATPVFADVLEDSWCIDPDLAEAAITSRTKAIIATHIYGNLCEMKRLLAVGAKHGIPIIEDAAEAIGSIYHGEHAGSIGKFGTFSFHGTKTVTTGEGGMFVTNDPALYEHVLTLSNHGRAQDETRQFWPKMLGFKYKMSNIQAAIGCAQMERIESLVAAKRAIFSSYRERLCELALRMNPEPTGTTNGYWMPTIVVSEAASFDREALLKDLATEAIDGRIFFWPLSSLPMFSPKGGNTRAKAISMRALNLPSYHDITEDEIDRVCAVVTRNLA